VRRVLDARRLVLTAIVVVLLVPRPTAAAACDDWLRQTRTFTGPYVLAGEPYARAYVFAMLLTCNGKTEAVTVQSATGRLPLCSGGQQVEVTGTLIWNKALVDGHYEINDPAGVTCHGVAQATSTAAAPGAAAPPFASSAPAPTPGVQEPRVAAAVPPSTVGSGVWTGRYKDSRGAGDVTFTLVRGLSTIAGTWKMRTGGGGPVTGLVDSGGTRIQIRMESLASDCPGTFEGAGEITPTTLTATYRGKDCEGAVSDGRLELTLQRDRTP
jgi:hypothetical protein